jgi:hypothetical protein
MPSPTRHDSLLVWGGNRVPESRSGHPRQAARFGRTGGALLTALLRCCNLMGSRQARRRSGPVPSLSLGDPR